MKISVFLVILLLLGQTAVAGSWGREDFAGGFELQLGATGAIYSLLLPEKIYTTVVHPDLADIRVFNGKGNVVPYLFKLEQAEPPQIIREQNLPFSPLYDFVPTGTVRQIETQISTDISGVGKESVGVRRTMIREKMEKTQKLNGYLLETSDITTIPFRLQFAVSGESDFMTTMTLEDSDDLTNWTFINRETLARLNYNGHLIEKNADSLIHRKKKYIRLSWPASEKNIIFDKIRAISYSWVQQPVSNWTRLNSTLPKKQTSANLIVLEFDSNGFMPVDTIRVGFSGHNNLIQGVIKSRAGLKETWRFRGQGTFYRLQNEDVALRNDTISLPMTTDRYWRLKISAEGGEFTSDSLPYLELGWHPHKLYFLDQGGGPYILAFGNGRMESAARSTENGLNNLLKDIEKQQTIIQTALIRREIELGGPDMLIPLPPPPPWKKWFLWGVLISGVMMIGGMAYSLYCQMRSANASDRADKEA